MYFRYFNSITAEKDSQWGADYPDERLAIFLYRMGRGDNIHTVAEFFGMGDYTVCNIVLKFPNWWLSWGGTLQSIFPQPREIILT